MARLTSHRSDTLQASETGDAVGAFGIEGCCGRFGARGMMVGVAVVVWMSLMAIFDSYS